MNCTSADGSKLLKDLPVSNKKLLIGIKKCTIF